MGKEQVDGNRGRYNFRGAWANFLRYIDVDKLCNIGETLKVKGYIQNLNIEREMLDFCEMDSICTSYPGRTTAHATIIFTEGDLNGLIGIMNRGDPIEIDMVAPKAKKQSLSAKWRMIRIGEE